MLDKFNLKILYIGLEKYPKAKQILEDDSTSLNVTT